MPAVIALAIFIIIGFAIELLDVLKMQLQNSPFTTIVTLIIMVGGVMILKKLFSRK
ncbi:hypothetical protein AGMMS49975_25140 [Clostridia bacterium]|nr:hypothetical protein AGMMS49975_25140 [Clostridia bacterium]